MNPALLPIGGTVLAALAVAARSRGVRREAALVVAGAALVAALFLAPALRLPSGIPSPAGTLAALPPWQGTGDPGDGNALLVDVTFQIQPWLAFLRHEIRAGRLPLWNPHQFAGAPFWANGQSAPLFPLHLLFVALPLQLGFVLLPWLRLAIAAAGAFALARALGVDARAAPVAGVAFALSGMLATFALFPMGNALALVPWVLWAVERLAARRGGAPALALLAGLQMLGGHPETSLHTALLATVYLAVRGGAAATWLRFVAGWATAAGLAAVELLPLALALPGSGRWGLPHGGPEPPLALLARQPLRLLLPSLYGDPARGTWWGPFNYAATAAFAGVVALVLAAAGLARARGDRRWRGIAAVLAVAFLAAYHVPGVREALATLPLVGRALPHRLIFGVELAIALFAAAGVERLCHGQARRALGFAAVAIVGLCGLSWRLFAADWARHATAREQLGWIAWAVAVAAVLALAAWIPPRLRAALALAVPALAAGELLVAHGRISGAIPFARWYPRTGAVEFLAGRPGRVAGTGYALRPNAAMVYGLADVRGDDPLAPLAHLAIYRTLAAASPVYFAPITGWRSPWLDRLAVRWVVDVPGATAAEPEWTAAYRGTDATVWERPGTPPLVRIVGAGTVRVVAAHAGRWQLAWSSPAPARLVIAELWDPGWSSRLAGTTPTGASVRGSSSPAARAEDALLAVEVPAGSGTVVLRYRPRGLAAGAAASLLAALGLVGIGVRSRLSARDPAAAPAPTSAPAPLRR